jgi:hypothetical protein
MLLRVRLAASACLVGAAAPALRAQPCQPYWVGGTPVPEAFGGRIVAWDDGSGPALYGIWTRNNRVFRWRDGDPQWTPIDTGLPNAGYSYSVSEFRVLDDGSGPHLCVIGENHTDPMNTETWVARWNGTAWELPWPGMFTNVRPNTGYPLASGDVGDGPSIYGEAGMLVGHAQHFYPARWVVDHWELLGDPPYGDIGEMIILDDGSGPALYVVGLFRSIGGVPAPAGLARWRDGHWEGVGGGQTFGTPQIAFDDGTGRQLYSLAANIGGEGIRGLVRFNGQEWEPVGQMDPPGAIYTLNAITVFDDGRGPAIYLGGGFSNMGGVPAHGIARYGRGGWSAVGDGVHNGSISFMASMPTPRGPSLFMTGGFTTAGGGSVMYTARLVGCPSCYANCDQSTAAPTLNVNDFLCFMTRFALHAPEANCTNDATIDLADFMCFMQRFAAGCP